MARLTNWSARISTFNGRWWTPKHKEKTVVVTATVPSGAASAAIRKFRRYHIENGQRIEGYRITLLRLKAISAEGEE